MIIQVLLIVATVSIAWYATRQGAGGRQLAMRRLAGIVTALAGVLAVLWPEAITWIANLVGVGRGTDLVLYGLVMAFAFVSASLYAKVRQLEDHLTVVVREQALAAVPDREG